MPVDGWEIYWKFPFSLSWMRKGTVERQSRGKAETLKERNRIHGYFDSRGSFDSLKSLVKPRYTTTKKVSCSERVSRERRKEESFPLSLLASSDIPSSACAPRDSLLSSRNLKKWKKMGHRDGKDVFKDAKRRKIHNFPILAFATSFSSAFSFSACLGPGNFFSQTRTFFRGPRWHCVSLLSSTNLA